MRGFALNSGRGSDKIQVALHLDQATRPAGISVKPLTRYTASPLSEGYIHMAQPLVAKANDLKSFPHTHTGLPNFDQLKYDIGRPRLRPP